MLIPQGGIQHSRYILALVKDFVGGWGGENIKFLQIAYYLKPPQEEVDEIFNLFLAKVDLPPDSLRIVRGDEAPEPLNKSETNAIIDAVMASDIDDGAKVKVYNIIKNIKNRP